MQPPAPTPRMLARTATKPSLQRKDRLLELNSSQLLTMAAICSSVRAHVSQYLVAIPLELGNQLPGSRAREYPHRIIICTRSSLLAFQNGRSASPPPAAVTACGNMQPDAIAPLHASHPHAVPLGIQCKSTPHKRPLKAYLYFGISTSRFPLGAQTPTGPAYPARSSQNKLQSPASYATAPMDLASPSTAPPLHPAPGELHRAGSVALHVDASRLPPSLAHHVANTAALRAQLPTPPAPLPFAAAAAADAASIAKAQALVHAGPSVSAFGAVRQLLERPGKYGSRRHGDVIIGAGGDVVSRCTTLRTARSQVSDSSTSVDDDASSTSGDDERQAGNLSAQPIVGETFLVTFSQVRLRWD